MKQTLSEAVMLFGTDEPVPETCVLQAGPLSCVLDQGALRCIRIDGIEAIRHIAFVVRDPDWGTWQPDINDLRIEQTSNTFDVTYQARIEAATGVLDYQIHIYSNPDQQLHIHARYQAVTDFVTNRTGFVVLHPLSGVCGQPVEVEHTNGCVSLAHFPDLIDPVQPFKNIRALTHTVRPGCYLRCDMRGDAFEMEDQRQWNDGSYKTYVRPLALPWPYRLSAGESQEQSITLSVQTQSSSFLQTANFHTQEQAPPFATRPSSTNNRDCVLSVGEATQVLAASKANSGTHSETTSGTTSGTNLMPRIGLGLEPQHLDSALEKQALLTRLAPQQLTIWHDLAVHSVEDLHKAVRLCRSVNAAAVLHAVIPDKDYRAEIAILCEQCAQAGLVPQAVVVSPAKYLESITPGSEWPQVTPLAELYDYARRCFESSLIGGGMLAFFPELNRHRPPIEHLDFVTHASNVITHASDEISITENLEALPYIIKTCRSFCADKPYHIGPSSIGMRFNPYGSRTIENPDNARVAMARMDPRQRGLLNAAWTLGYVAHLVRGGVDVINLHAPTGEFGLINHKESWARPGFDSLEKPIYPAFTVVAGLAEAAGRPVVPVRSSFSRGVEAVAYQADSTTVLWAANLTMEPQSVILSGLSADRMSMRSMTLSSFDTLTDRVDGFEATEVDHVGKRFTLDKSAVARLEW